MSWQNTDEEKLRSRGAIWCDTPPTASRLQRTNDPARRAHRVHSPRWSRWL